MPNWKLFPPGVGIDGVGLPSVRFVGGKGTQELTDISEQLTIQRERESDTVTMNLHDSITITRENVFQKQAQTVINPTFTQVIKLLMSSTHSAPRLRNTRSAQAKS